MKATEYRIDAIPHGFALIRVNYHAQGRHAGFIRKCVTISQHRTEQAAEAAARRMIGSRDHDHEEDT